MTIVPLSQKEAFAFIAEHHRHHKPPQGWKFGLGCQLDGSLVGVAVVGRPVARNLDDGRTLEVTRICTDSSAKNVVSKLLSACSKAARAMGYERMFTYILDEESGCSLKASGWSFDCASGGGSWSRPSRGRSDKHPTTPKKRWRIDFVTAAREVGRGH